MIALAGALIFYTEAFMSIALALVAICLQEKRSALLVEVSVLAGHRGLDPAGAFLVLQAGLLASGAYPGNLGRSVYIPDFLFRFLPVLTLGETAAGIRRSGCGCPRACAWLASHIIVARGSRREIQFIGAIVLVPFLLLGVLSSRVNIFHPRYVLATVPAFVLLISLGSARLAAWIAKAAGTRPAYLMPLLLAPWIILSAWSLHAYYNDEAFRKSPAWDELGDFLNDRVTIDDLVIQLERGRRLWLLLPRPAEERALPSGPGNPQTASSPNWRRLGRSYDSIYVVSNAIPSWPNARVVEDWMRENMQPVTLSDASGLAIRQYQGMDRFGGPARCRWQALGARLTCLTTAFSTVPCQPASCCCAFIGARLQSPKTR